ncbi:MAG: thiamine ABC transporter substrate binding subunit [Gammaproteobacteria bacterium]|nr:MAG: thiamine ABC transporter substrate binding subunit [Gammaproteobacteria bacterium]
MKQLLNIALLSVIGLSTVAFAHHAPTLTVYSYDSFTSDWGAGPKLKESFEKQCNCHVKFVPFEDGVTMFNRLRLEGDKPKADVIIGLDNNLLKDAEASNLFAKTDIDISGLSLPIQWESQTFIPFDYGQYAFIYDNSKIKNPPSSLKALVDNEKLSIIYQDPRTSTVGRGLLAWVNAVYGDKAESAWKQLAKHTVTVGKGWSESYGAFLKGESDVVLSYNTSPLYHQIHEGKNNYSAMTFDEGHIVQIEVAAKLKASKQSQLAEQFIAFMLTPEAQKAIALSNIMLPVIKTDIEPRFNAFKPAKTLAVPQPEKAVSKAQLDVWQRALSQ